MDRVTTLVRPTVLKWHWDQTTSLRSSLPSCRRYLFLGLYQTNFNLMERIVIYFAVYLFCFYSFHRMRGHNLWRIKLPLTAGFLNYWRFLKSIVCIKQWNQHLKSIITWLFLIEIAKLECGLVEKHFSFLSISNLFTEVLHNFITPFCNWARLG